VEGVKDHLRALGKAAPPSPNTPALEGQATPPPAAEDAGTTFDLRPLLIGFGAGIFFAVLAYWQIRELNRRRHQRAS
jgi:hypothetical protein